MGNVKSGTVLIIEKSEPSLGVKRGWLPSTLRLWGVLLLMVLVGCGEAKRSHEVEQSGEVDWPKATLDYYNPFNLTNAPGCPNIPGVFFL